MKRGQEEQYKALRCVYSSKKKKKMLKGKVLNDFESRICPVMYFYTDVYFGVHRL